MEPSFRQDKKSEKAHVIVIGNEKGGSGKTTTTMHLISALLRLGFKVASLDIDARQRSLSRYVENRLQTMEEQKIRLPMSTHHIIHKSPYNIVQEAEDDERERFEEIMQDLLPSHDFIVIDGPGNDTFLSRFAHSYADTVITPINDSFIDLDVLGKVDGNTLKVQKPSIYSEMIWEQKLKRAKRDGGSIEWIVMRNRLSNIDARNKRFMGKAVQELARRIGFRIAPGFSERVIFRELFLKGLTVLDVIDTSSNIKVSISHVAARQEVRDLLANLKLPKIDAKITNLRLGDKKEEPKEKAVADEKAVAPVKAKSTADTKKAEEAKKAEDIKKQEEPKKAPEAEKVPEKPLEVAKKPDIAPQSAVSASPKIPEKPAVKAPEVAATPAKVEKPAESVVVKSGAATVPPVAAAVSPAVKLEKSAIQAPAVNKNDDTSVLELSELAPVSSAVPPFNRKPEEGKNQAQAVQKTETVQSQQKSISAEDMQKVKALLQS